MYELLFSNDFFSDEAPHFVLRHKGQSSIVATVPSDIANKEENMGKKSKRNKARKVDAVINQQAKSGVTASGKDDEEAKEKELEESKPPVDYMPFVDTVLHEANVPVESFPTLRCELKTAAAQYLEDERCLGKEWFKDVMPASYALVVDGKLSSGHFTACFRGAINVVLGDKATRSSLLESNHCWHVLLQDALKIAEQAIPDRFARMAGLNRDAAEKFRQKLAAGINSRTLFAEEHYWLKNMDMSRACYLVFLQASTDISCEELASQLDSAFFRGKKGVFLRKCPVYKKDEKFFSDFLDFRGCNELRIKRCLGFSDIRKAAKRVEHRSTPLHRMCWGCNQKNNNLKVCSSCGIALFCGKKCIKKAWKCGHKDNCPQLKEKHSFFENELQVLSAHHNADIADGRVPAIDSDFRVLSIDRQESLHLSLWRGTQVEGLQESMEHFYTNLDLIRKGEIWFFPASETNDIQRSSGGDRSCNDDLFMSIILTFLRCDYVGYLRSRKIPLSEFSKTFPIRRSNMAKHGGFHKATLSPSRFIELYDATRKFDGNIDELKSHLEKLEDTHWNAFVSSCHPKREGSYDFYKEHLCYHRSY